MSSLIEIKEQILKAEKENEEKLKKEGFKQISSGKGYIVLSKDSQPSNSISSVNANKTFDIGNVFIKLPSSKYVQSTATLYLYGEEYLKIPMVLKCSVIPCAAFMRYIKSYPVVGTVVETLEKKKGFTNRFNVSVDVKASASIGFFGCEASLEVSTGFEYGKTVTSETTLTWTQTLTEGTYIVYQNVLVYAYIFYNATEVLVQGLNKGTPGANLRLIPSLNAAVMFVPINRDDPFTLRYSDVVWDPIEYDTLIDYLSSNTTKWT
ncbi:hypothetical protein ACTFIR_008688 [Dictyostelium discoideum]